MAALATLAQLRSLLNKQASDTADDELLQLYLDAASESFLSYTGRTYAADAVPAHVKLAVLIAASFNYQRKDHLTVASLNQADGSTTYLRDLPSDVQAVFDAERVYG